MCVYIKMINNSSISKNQQYNNAIIIYGKMFSDATWGHKTMSLFKSEDFYWIVIKRLSSAV